MATQSAVFTFALPEDENSDQLLIKSATSKTGAYSTDSTVTYAYGTTSYEYDSLDDTKWYKIQFNNSSDSETGPESEPIFGGDFSNASPFLAISTGTDGANFASTQDVFDYCSLTSEDVSLARVSQSLRRARAVVDLRTAELDLDRFTRSFDSATSRKKHNATLRILKEAEINIALGNLYRGVADSLIVKSMRDARDGTEESVESLSLGSTSLSGGTNVNNPTHAAYLATLGDRYFQVGSAMLAAIQPTSIELRYTPLDSAQSPKFKLPFNGV